MNDTPTTIIRPRRGWIGLNLPELWRFRELFTIFVWRDIKVRYKQTVLGVTWAIIQPVVMMVIFSFIFGRFASVPSDDIPYPIFFYSGLLLWNYFSLGLTNTSNVLVENENVLKKIYFPRLVLPFSTALTPIVDFLLSFLVLVGLMFFYRFTPTVLGVILFPGLLLLSYLSVAGLGAFFAAVNVKYRDVRYAIPFLIQILFFLTPVIYPTSLIDDRFQWILALNPMTGIIEAARAGLLGQQPIDFSLLGISAAAASLFFLAGIFYFRRTERFFADVA